MTATPRIPMSPAELPQQRIHAVVGLPPRPDPFKFGVGYGDFPEGIVPKRGVPRLPSMLVQVEWAQSPASNGLTAFYLQRRRRVWLLWTRTLDDNAWPWRWDWLPVGWCPRRGVDERQAATHLRLEYWRFETGGEGRPYDWINEEGDLSVADLEAIGS